MVDKIKDRVLLVTTYPLANPLHGGQRRAHEIFQRLVKAGFDCKVAAFFGRTNYEGEEARYERYFCWDMAAEEDYIAGGYRPDVMAYKLAQDTDGLIDRFLEMVANFKPSVVQFEQCFLSPLASRVKEILPSCLIVYSSHNHEEKMISQLVSNEPKILRDHAISTTRMLERDLVDLSDMLIAVSKEDAVALHCNGQEVVVAPNGTHEPSKFDEHGPVVEGLMNTAFALFAGSYHIPNAEGIEYVFGNGVSSLQPDEALVIAGAVGLLLQKRSFPVNAPAFDPNRIRIVGVQDNATLSKLLAMCTAVVLPIVSGGGTNLKTAEALASGKAVIGTTTAFRGYEAFMDFPTVRIADEPGAFMDATTSALREGTPARLSVDNRVKLQDLYWEKTLADIVPVLKALLRNRDESIMTELQTSQNWPHGELDIKNLPAEEWHPYEPANRLTWTRRNVAIIELPEQAKSVSSELRVTGHLYNPTGSAQHVIVTIQDVIVVDTMINTRFDFRIKIDAETTERTLIDSRIEFKIWTTSVHSPKDYGSEDGRQLGIGLAGATIVYDGSADADYPVASELSDDSKGGSKRKVVRGRFNLNQKGVTKSVRSTFSAAINWARPMG